MNTIKEFFSEDLLNFKKEINFIINNLDTLDFLVVEGRKGEGKSYFLDLLAKELKNSVSKVSDLINKRKKDKEKDVLLIDDFHNSILLSEEQLLRFLESLDNFKGKLILAYDSSFLEKDNIKAKFIRNFLSSALYSINLRKFYKEKVLDSLVQKYLEFLENNLGIKFKEDNKEFLSLLIKTNKLSIFQIKKLFTNLFIKLKYVVSFQKEIDIKKFFPSSVVSSFYWNKEVSSSFQSLFESKKAKETPTMDLNLIANSFINEKKEVKLKEIVKEYPEFIGNNIFVYDYNEGFIFNGISLGSLIKDLKKPDLIGYRDDELLLIYTVENLENLSIADLEKIKKFKDLNKNDKIKFVLIIKADKKNEELVLKHKLYNVFDSILELDVSETHL